MNLKIVFYFQNVIFQILTFLAFKYRQRLWFMFLRVVVRVSTKSLVVTVIVESESLSIESLELTESL